MARNLRRLPQGSPCPPLVPDSLEGLSALTGLAALSLDGNRLASASGLAGLASLTRLTCLSLASNPLPNLTTLPLLPALLRLDLRDAGLTSLAGLGGAAPLLRVLRAERNRLRALPPDLGLLWLSELRLDGNALEGYSAGGGGGVGGGSAGLLPWPWLPSLRVLHLRGCGLAAPPRPAHRLGALAQLDLSSNALASLGGCLAALAPLAPSLRRLQLEGNPLAAAGLAGGDDGSGAPYPAAVLAALPGLQELDRRPIPEAERQAHLQRVSQPQLRGASARYAVHIDDDAVWEASTLMWALSSSEAAWAAAIHASQLQQLRAHAGRAYRRSGTGDSSGGSGDSSDDDSDTRRGPLLVLVAGLELLQSLPQQQSLVGEDASASASEVSDLQRRHWMLASSAPSALQSLQQLCPAYFGAMLSRLARAATAIQRWWRGHAARLLREHLGAQREHERVHAAAGALQAAWRGWAVRRRHAWVRSHLERWRVDWRAAQAALEAHVQGVAATCLQAAWRGRRVRAALAHVRAAARAQLVAAALEDGDSLDAELAADESSLAGLLTGLLGAGGGILGVPEMLRPELAAQELSFVEGRAAAATAALGPATAGMRNSLSLALADSGCGGDWLPPAAPSAGGAGAAAPAAVAAGASGCAVAEGGWAFASETTAAAFAQLRARQAAQARKREVRERLRDPEARLQVFQRRNHLPFSGPGAAAGPASEGREVGAMTGQQRRRRRSSRQLPPTVFHSSGGSAADRLGTTSPLRRCSLPPL